MSLRAIVGARVSVMTGPQKVSHLAQYETCARWVADKGHTVAGSFKDLDVSASVSPFKRPDLGLWLTDEKAGDWDIIVLSKIDRMFRSTKDCVDFARWCEEHKKILVFAEDGLLLNYREKDASGSLESMMSELFIYIGSFFAQLELNRFKSRASDGHRILRQTDRWPSGVAPLGFRVIDHPSGKGKALDTDPDGKTLLHEMAGKLIDGWSFVRIVEWLNETGKVSNMGKAKAASGKTGKKSTAWTTRSVIEALTSPRTQGIKTHRGEPVLTGDGEMIELAPPTFDENTWIEVQAAAEQRRQQRRRPTTATNPMLGVGYCAKCGASLTHKKTYTKVKDGTTLNQYYVCGRSPRQCVGVTIRAELADILLEENFLAQYGDEEVTRRVFVPGEDNSTELDKVEASLKRLRMESDAGLIVTREDEDLYESRLTGLIARRTVLLESPRQSAQWVYESTGESFSAAWVRSTPEERRKMLTDAGVRFELTNKFVHAVSAPWDATTPEPIPGIDREELYSA